MKIRLPLLLMPIAILVLSACGAKQPSVNPDPVPNSLVTIEAAAEDIIDFAPSGNWEKISKDVTAIENAWKSYQPQAEENGASQEIQDRMTSAIERLQTATKAKDSAATMQGSNDVSAAVVELFALYTPKVPADIGRLDVLERQIVLDVAAHDYGAAMTNLENTKSVWEEVKPSVLQHDGQSVAEEFEASLTAQESELNAKDDEALTNDVRDALEIVDALERLY
jgi:hypothetical protein